MTAVDITKGITGILTTAMTVIALLFANFLARRANSTIFGIEIPTRLVHFLLGPVLVALNGALLLFLCALHQTATKADVVEIQRQNKFLVLGLFVNPFYVSKHRLVGAVGYAFLIILWWLGLHAFLYSLSFDGKPHGPWLFAWQILIWVVYLSLGLACMAAIHFCWQKFGMQSYTLKWLLGFIGIPIGALLPPIILRLGLPDLPFLRI